MRRLFTALLTAVAFGAIAFAPATGASSKPPSGSSTGTGQVFLPNPVADAAEPEPDRPERRRLRGARSRLPTVTLTNLDGSGYLVGDWANILSETGDRAYSPTNTFIYRRNDDRFEQVMAYYWVTEAQKYIQSLGFGTDPRGRSTWSRRTSRINQWGVDNSYSWDKHDMLRFGKGGVDDAEDAEVILHEYGHAVHDAQVAGFGIEREAGAIGEAFGDYLAVTVTQRDRPDARRRRASPTGTRSRTPPRRRTACAASTRTCTYPPT